MRSSFGITRPMEAGPGCRLARPTLRRPGACMESRGLHGFSPPEKATTLPHPLPFPQSDALPILGQHGLRPDLHSPRAPPDTLLDLDLPCMLSLIHISEPTRQ